MDPIRQKYAPDTSSSWQRDCLSNDFTLFRSPSRHLQSRLFLMKTMRNLTLILSLLLATAGSARAQTPSNDNWHVGIYPVFGWIPLDIDIKVDVPPFDDGEGGGTGSIVDGRFDGAFLAGFYASKGRFRIDGDGMWAAVGGDRVETAAEERHEGRQRAADRRHVPAARSHTTPQLVIP